MASNRFWVFLLAILSLASLIGSSVNIPPQVEAASTRSISLIGFFNAWNNTGVANPTISVTQGDTITIQLSSGDGAVHRFFVDVDKNGITPDCPGADVCSNVFPPSTTLTFTVNFAPGTYTYYCSVHPTTMLGQFVVLQPPVTGGGGGGRHPLEM
jgi:plastocyanin